MVLQRGVAGKQNGWVTRDAKENKAVCEDRAVRMAPNCGVMDSHGMVRCDKKLWEPVGG